MRTTILLLSLIATLIGPSSSYGQDTAAPAGAPIDATLYTTYTLDAAQTNVTWYTCGSTENTSGCFGAGNLDVFGKVGAMMEGNPTTDLSTNTVSRAIYILDIASGSTGNGVTLNVYEKTDMITPDYDTVTVTLLQTITLPLRCGATVGASMAANDGFLFIGTNQSPRGVKVNKPSLTFTKTGGFLPPINVTAITSDQYGYVTVTFGSLDGQNGFYLFGPDGGVRGFGGGAEFTLNTIQAVLPSTIP